MPTSDEAYLKLLSLAVHELRTPVGIVGGYLRMLQTDHNAPLGEQQQRLVEAAGRSCTHMVAIIAEMSDLQKLDANLIAVAQQPLDLCTVTRQAAADLHEGEDRDVRLEVRGPDSGAPILGDQVRLGAALRAVFRAILREQPRAGTVVSEIRLVPAAEGPASAILVVAPDADVSSAADRPPAAFDEGRGGMGLALPLARRVIERHQGRLWAPSGGLERGAAVISFPLTELNR